MDRRGKLAGLARWLALGGATFGVLIWLGYSASWTGFSSYVKPSAEYQHYRTLWDWLGLLVVPVALAIVAFVLNRAQSLSAQRSTTNQQREAALQSCLKDLSELLLKYQLLTSADNAVRTIARARTLTVLPELDGRRKGVLIRFLLESKLLYERSTLSDIPESLVRLQGADLRKANLSGLHFNQVDLSGVDLRGADLRHAWLKGARFDEHTAVDDKWRLVYDAIKYTWQARNLLRGQDMREVNFCKVSLEEYDLRGTDLSGADLQEVNLKDTKINWRTKLDPKWHRVWQIINQRASLDHLAGADLNEAYLAAARLWEANLRGAKLNSANLESGLLGGADLSRADLLAAKLEDAELAGATLRTCWAWIASFQEANLEGADLTEGNFLGAKFIKANLRNANLTQADLTEADLQGADLTGAILTDTNLTGCRYNDETRWPTGFQGPPPEG